MLAAEERKIQMCSFLDVVLPLSLSSLSVSGLPLPAEPPRGTGAATGRTGPGREVLLLPEGRRLRRGSVSSPEIPVLWEGRGRASPPREGGAGPGGTAVLRLPVPWVRGCEVWSAHRDESWCQSGAVRRCLALFTVKRLFDVL